MILILLTICLSTMVFAFTVASFAWEDLVLGAGLSVVLLIAFRKVLLPDPLPPNAQVIKSIVMFPLFVLASLREIVSGTWQVASYVIGVRKLEHPGIVRVPLGERSRVSAGFAGFVMTLSPGTFLVAIDWEERVMLVHAIDASDPDKLREDYDAFYKRYERHIVP